jgi:uncharacterized protein (DUF1810 family)
MPVDPPDSYALERFVVAQASMYERVVSELRAGTKRSHWIWFIFPQLRGLGRSPTAHTYGIASASEARAFLAHPVLGPRLIECVDLMLQNAAKPLSTIMPFPDDLKFVSSMTLFASVAADPQPFQAALHAFNAGKPDAATLHLLRHGE